MRFESAGEGDLRLMGGAQVADGSAEYGRLEVFHRGGWGTVCDDFFITRDDSGFRSVGADVACRELGFEHGVQISTMVCPSKILGTC